MDRIGSIANGPETCLHDYVIRKIFAILGSAIFLVLAPGFVAGLVPWWISHWRCRNRLVGAATSPFCWRRSACLRRHRPPGFIRPIRDTRDRHASSRFSHPSFGCHGTISLCPESHVRGGCEHHPWSGFDLRKCKAVAIRWACLASVSPLCAGLRRAHAKSEFWF